MQINTDGLILMEQTVGESDKLITILTRKEGLIRAFVKGAKRIKSKNASSTQLLSYSQFSIYKGKDTYIVNEAQTKDIFFSLRQDIEKLSLAQYFCELAIAFVHDETESEDFLRLILNAIYCMANNKMPDLLIKSIVELRACSISGYMPNLICCNDCGAYESNHMYFLIKNSVIYCDNCYNISNGSGISMSKGVVTALRYIIYSDFSKLFSFSVSDESIKTLCFITEQYILSKIDRPFKTLDFYRKICTNNLYTLGE